MPIGIWREDNAQEHHDEHEQKHRSRDIDEQARCFSSEHFTDNIRNKE